MSERQVNFSELFNFCSPWNHLGGVQKSTSLPVLYRKSILAKLSETETEENTIVNLCKFWPISHKSISNKCVPKDSVSGIQNFTVSSHIDLFIHSFNSRFNSFYRFVFQKICILSICVTAFAKFFQNFSKLTIICYNRTCHKWHELI